MAATRARLMHLATPHSPAKSRSASALFCFHLFKVLHAALFCVSTACVVIDPVSVVYAQPHMHDAKHTATPHSPAAFRSAAALRCPLGQDLACCLILCLHSMLAVVSCCPFVCSLGEVPACCLKLYVNSNACQCPSERV